MPNQDAFAGSWTSLPIPLTEWILDVVHANGYEQMTPVQASTIPLFMKNKDVVVEAVTGSGKTLAFAIPVLERLIQRETKLKNNEVGALIISPTRELATQIHSVFSTFLQTQPEVDDTASPRYPKPLLLVSSDSSSPAKDIQRFLESGADIVVGTPGRIEEFLLGKGRNSVSVKELEVLVMDEADRLLDLGFQNTLTKIITHLPKQRRTGLFSATMTDADALTELVRVGLRNPARIVVKVQTKKVDKLSLSKDSSQGAVTEERRTPASLQNLYISCRYSEKLVKLTRILKHEIQTKDSSHFIIYFATCAAVDYFYKILPAIVDSNVTFYSLHGSLSPSVRTRTLHSFASALPTSSNPSVLLATDVAARGLDLPNVDAVIQFDPPTDTKAFSHRCGRTARAGRQGTAWTLLCGREIEFCEFLKVRKIPLKKGPHLSENINGDADDQVEDPDVGLYLDKIRTKLRTDRTLHDQSAKAFVSFVRAYSKHEASYIFRVKDLDMVGLAKSYGLLRLPRMPELKDIDTDGWEDADVDWDTFAYADPAQEAKRLSTAASRPTEDSPSRPKTKKKDKNTAWSGQKDRQDERLRRHEKKKQKKKWLKSQTPSTVATDSTKNGKRIRNDGDDVAGDEDDWEDLAREEKMAKRLKKGEVSQREFDAEFGDLA